MLSATDSLLNIANQREFDRMFKCHRQSKTDPPFHLSLFPNAGLRRGRDDQAGRVYGDQNIASSGGSIPEVSRQLGISGNIVRRYGGLLRDLLTSCSSSKDQMSTKAGQLQVYDYDDD